MEDKFVESAMQIIMYAGDARKACMEALDAVVLDDFELADEKMKAANAEIVQAHRIQTDAIQGEMSGQKMEYSVLFAHAQDTLMTIYSEINIAKRLIKIAKHLGEKLD